MLWIMLQILANVVDNSSSFAATRSRAALPAAFTGNFPVQTADGFGDGGTMVVGVERMTYRACPRNANMAPCVTLLERGVQGTQPAAHPSGARVRADSLSRWESAIQFPSGGSSFGGVGTVIAFANAAFGLGEWVVGVFVWDYSFLNQNAVGQIVRYVIFMPLSLAVLLRFSQLVASLAGTGFRLLRGGV